MHDRRQPTGPIFALVLDNDVEDFCLTSLYQKDHTMQEYGYKPATGTTGVPSMESTGAFFQTGAGVLGWTVE
jgi:hypothetical protein